MNTTVIFSIGAVIFAITVYGAVMGAGIALTRGFLSRNPEFKDRPGYDSNNEKPDES